MRNPAYGKPLRTQLVLAGVSLLLLFGFWLAVRILPTLPVHGIDRRPFADRRSYQSATHTVLGLPANWKDLPSPDALVRLNTADGSFMLPMGYLSYWWAYRQDPVTTAPDGTRVFDGGLAFHFEFPSGGMSFNTNWVTAVPDDDSEPLPDHSVVWIMNVGPPKPHMAHQEIEALALYVPGRMHLEPSIGDRKTDPVYYRGVVAGSGPGHRVGVVMGCVVHCLFTLYLERRNLTVEGYLDGRFRSRMLEVAGMVQDFYDRWYEPEP